MLHGAADNLPPLLEVGLGGVSREGHVLHLPSQQLAEGQGQVSSLGSGGTNQEQVLTQSILEKKGVNGGNRGKGRGEGKRGEGRRRE